MSASPHRLYKALFPVVVTFYCLGMNTICWVCKTNRMVDFAMFKTKLLYSLIALPFICMIFLMMGKNVFASLFSTTSMYVSAGVTIVITVCAGPLPLCYLTYVQKQTHHILLRCTQWYLTLFEHRSCLN